VLSLPKSGGLGLGWTVINNDDVTPSWQQLVPKTEIFPETALFAIFTVMVLLLIPLVIINPCGTFQIYPVEYAITGTE
jgi:hypothetical protein